MISRRIVETINYLYHSQHEHNSFSKLFKDLEFRSHSHSFRPHVKRRTVIHITPNSWQPRIQKCLEQSRLTSTEQRFRPKNGVCRHATERDTKSARNDLINFIEGSCDYGNARLPTVKHALHEENDSSRKNKYAEKKEKKNEFDEYILVGFNNEGNNRRTPRRLLLLDRYFFNWHQRNGAKLVKVGRSLDTLPFYLARHPN